MWNTRNSSERQWQRGRRRSLLARILVPNPDFPASKRMLGFLVRVVLVVGIPWVVFKEKTERFLGGEMFSQLVSDGLRQRLGADLVQVDPFSWHKDSARTAKIKATFGAGSPIAGVTLEDVRFTLPMRKRFDRVWEIDRLGVRGLSVRLRGAALKQEKKEKKGKQYFGGFLTIDPEFERTNIHYAHAEYLDVSWGDGEFNSGRLEDARATFVPMKRRGIWKIEVKGGRLHQNWLKDVEIVSADLEWDGERLVCESSEFLMPKGGTGSMSFTFNPATLSIDSTLDLRDANLAGFLDFNYLRYFSGSVSGRVRIAGSFNPGEKLTSELALTPESNCYCQGIRFFEELGKMTLNPSLGKLPMESGNISLRAVGGNLEGVSASLVIGTFGNVRFEAEANEQIFQGTADLKIEDYVFRRAQALKDEVFSSHTEGWWVRRVEIKGSIDQWFLQVANQVKIIAQRNESSPRKGLRARDATARRSQE